MYQALRIAFTVQTFTEAKMWDGFAGAESWQVQGSEGEPICVDNGLVLLIQDRNAIEAHWEENDDPRSLALYFPIATQAMGRIILEGLIQQAPTENVEILSAWLKTFKFQ